MNDAERARRGRNLAVTDRLAPFRFCRPCRGFGLFRRPTHGLRRGLISAAAPRLKHVSTCSSVSARRAKDSSPGRQPWDSIIELDQSPGRGDRNWFGKFVASLLLVLVLIAKCGAQNGSAHATPVEGPPFAADFAGFDSQQNIKFKIGNKLRIMPAAELVRWGNYRDVETGPQIVLASGGVLRADVLSLSETQLIIGDASGLGSVLWDESALPIEAVCGLLWQPPADPLSRDRLLFKLLSLPTGDDQVLLEGGEALSGTLLSVPPAGRFAEKLNKQELAAAEVFTLQVPRTEKPLQIAANKVLAVRFGSAEVTKPAKQAFTRVGFRDGSWLVASKFETARTAFQIHFPGGGKLTANNAFGDGSAEWFWKQVSLLQPISDRCVYVSDLPPLGYKHLPFISGEWKFGSDQNVLGGQLRTREQVHLKGLGMFPASRLAYTLDGKYRRLQGTLAIDDRAGLQGSVTFRVLLEDASGQWATSYESPIIRGGDMQPVELSLDVKNAQRIAILVDFADRGDQCDYADWLDLRLLK